MSPQPTTSTPVHGSGLHLAQGHPDIELDVSLVSTNDESVLNAAFLVNTSQADSGFTTQLHPGSPAPGLDHANYEDSVILIFREFWDSLSLSMDVTGCHC